VEQNLWEVGSFLRLNHLQDKIMDILILIEVVYFLLYIFLHIYHTQFRE